MQQTQQRRGNLTHVWIFGLQRVTKKKQYFGGPLLYYTVQYHHHLTLQMYMYVVPTYQIFLMTHCTISFTAGCILSTLLYYIDFVKMSADQPQFCSNTATRESDTVIIHARVQQTLVNLIVPIFGIKATLFLLFFPRSPILQVFG